MPSRTGPSVSFAGWPEGDHVRYVLWGSAGHAKVLAGIIAMRGGRVIALFDNNDRVESVLPGVPLYYGAEGFSRWCELDQPNLDGVRAIAAIGGNRGRDRIAIHELFRARGLVLDSIVHPQASVCVTAKLGEGTQVLAQAVVAADAKTGQACIVNHHANVDHDCMLGDGVHLAPGATLCGNVTVGNNVMLGAGSVVLPRLAIGNDTMVGAGAVVTRSLPDGVVVTGVPARIVGKT